MILVSSCLLGINSKYDGSKNTVQELISLCPKGLLLPVCPEQLGGAPTPRPPAEIKGGTGLDVLEGRTRVYSNLGVDLTDSFITGAQEVLRICRLYGVTAAILKERSPSCGCNIIYDGSFKSIRMPGQGVTAALLKSEGIQIYSEEQLSDGLLQQLLSLK